LGKRQEEIQKFSPGCKTLDFDILGNPERLGIKQILNDSKVDLLCSFAYLFETCVIGSLNTKVEQQYF
jgi:hypothetical protein